MIPDEFKYILHCFKLILSQVIKITNKNINIMIEGKIITTYSHNSYRVIEKFILSDNRGPQTYYLCINLSSGILEKINAESIQNVIDDKIIDENNKSNKNLLYD